MSEQIPRGAATSPRPGGLSGSFSSEPWSTAPDDVVVGDRLADRENPIHATILSTEPAVDDDLSSCPLGQSAPTKADCRKVGHPGSRGVDRNTTHGRSEPLRWSLEE